MLQGRNNGQTLKNWRIKSYSWKPSWYLIHSMFLENVDCTNKGISYKYPTNAHFSKATSLESIHRDKK